MGSCYDCKLGYLDSMGNNEWDEDEMICMIDGTVISNPGSYDCKHFVEKEV